MIRLTLSTIVLAIFSQTAAAQYPGWRHCGSLYILTTPDGADLPAAASETNFPLLVRLDKDWFDFSQARSRGEDIRFATADGRPLAYQIAAWNPAQGAAAVWVCIPAIKGNAAQEIKLYWGKANARSESSGPAVFNAENGYASVLHLEDDLKDEVGTLTPKDSGSTPVAGVVGQGRHIEKGRGINGGDHITGFPCSDQPFTSEGWFRPAEVGGAALGWGRYATRYNGRTGDGNEVVINFNSPPSISWSSDGPGGVSAKVEPKVGQWCHVAATYADGTSRIFVNGKLEGSNYHKAAMSLVRDVGMTIGGLRSTFQYAGDLDEIRVSRVARSPDWIKLEYENQKARQTLVGPLVQPGGEFAVSPGEISVDEGKSVTVTARAGGARKIYWIVKRDGAETVVAADRLSYTLDAGRVVADTAYVLQFKAVYADGVKTRNIPVKIREDIPEPVFSLHAPAGWNGRDTIEVVPQIANLKAMQAKGAGDLTYRWSISGGAVIKQVVPGRLILKRSQCGGTICVTLALSNGGEDIRATTSIRVQEPASDPWVERTPAKDEQPEDNQFYARNDKNEGMLYYNGTLDRPADSVVLRVWADDKLVFEETRVPGPDKAYAFAVKLKPGLIKYRVVLGIKTGGRETVLRTAKNLVCGDAYIIDGQSNAEATGPNNGPEEDPVTPVNDWIRSYGNQLEGITRGGWGNAVRTHIWGKPNYGCHQIGAWGMVLAKDLVEKHRIPICIINGAYGGTPIHQHQPNPANHYDTSGGFYQNPYKIYGCLLTRVTAARLTHGIRGVFWHQGENDSGSGGPTGDWNYKSYQQYFIDMAAAWKQDYPNIQHYYVFQVWPLPCCMGPKDDQIRELQRTLPRLFSNLRVMSTIGAVSPHAGRGACHFDLEDYAKFARFMGPLVEQDHYGLVPKQAVTSPNLGRAWFTAAAKDEIALDFGQPMAWNKEAAKSFYLGGKPASIQSGSAAGNIVTLKLAAVSEGTPQRAAAAVAAAAASPAAKKPSPREAARTITYLMGRDWNGSPELLLRGANGIAALTFCDVPIAAPQSEPTASGLDAAVAAGDFAAYQENLTKWLNGKTPAKVTENGLKSLLKDAAFVLALDQRQFISTCGADKLGAFAKADPAHQAFLAWLMKDAGILDLYLEAGGVPTGDASITTLKFWSKVFHADLDSRKGIYLKLAISTAIMHPVPFTDERTPRLTQPYEGRYLYYKKAHQAGNLVPSFDRLSVWEMQKVVEGMGAPPEDLTWVRDMIRTWRPDLLKDNRMVRIVSEVRYGYSPIPIVDMASVLDAGGICGRRSHFGRKTCAAFGIPAIGILQPRHAALAWKNGDAWQIEYGAGWHTSTCEGGQDGPAFVAEAAARSHAAEFSQSEHLKWFASALTAKDTAKEIVTVAEKLVPRSTDAKAMARDPETKAEMEANAGSKKTGAAGSAAASVPASAEVARTGADTIHIPADRFSQMANVMVYDSWPAGSGKQINFQKNMDKSWADYAIEVPKTGMYALVLKLAAANRDQILSVSVDARPAATIKVPNTRGLWGTTPPLELKLEQGKQTLRIAAPSQRGIAVRWIELTAAR